MSIDIPNLNEKDYKIIKSIGQGTYGTVYLVENTKTGKLYAKKLIKLSKKEDIKNSPEMISNSKVDHPAILKCYGYFPPNEKNNSISYIFDYMPNGSLKQVLSKIRKKDLSFKLTGTKKYIILLGVAIGMQYLHSNGIIHRDLKPDNILLDENFYPKICDFGVSYYSDISYVKIEMDDSAGTPLYMAPEIFSNDLYSYKVDVYSFSLIAYELLTGKVPYESFKSSIKLSSYVKQGNRPNLSGLDHNIQIFFNKCWSNNPIERPSFDEIVEQIENNSFIKAFDADQIEISSYMKKIDQTFNYVSEEINVLEKNIEKRNKYELYELGIKYMDGFYVKENLEKAQTYLKMASDKGNSQAMFLYSFFLLYINITSNVEFNKEECYKYCKAGADLGNSGSMLIYAFLAYYGKGIPVNKKEAFKYVKMAADKGDFLAMFIYANWKYYENGDEADKEEAIKYMKKVADLKIFNAMKNYANIMFDRNNNKEAAHYLKMAADLGDVESMRSYGTRLLMAIKFL